MAIKDRIRIYVEMYRYTYGKDIYGIKIIKSKIIVQNSQKMIDKYRKIYH